MRIGIDATCWANERGYGRFTRELLPAMAAHARSDSFVCFVDARAAERFDLVRRNVLAVQVDQTVSPTLAAAADGRRSVADILRLTRAVGREGLDVFFSPSIYTYFPLPPRLPAPAEFRVKLEKAGFVIVRLSRLNALLGLAEIQRELEAKRSQHTEYQDCLLIPRRKARACHRSSVTGSCLKAAS